MRYASTQPAVAPTPAPAAAAAPVVDPIASPSVLSDIDTTPVSLSGSDLLNMPEQIGFLKNLGLDYGFGPTALMEWILEHTYIYTGLPWWASIGLVSLAIRAVLVKPMFTAAEMAQKLQDLKRDPKYEQLEKEVMSAFQGGQADQYAMLDKRNKMKAMRRAVGYKMLPASVPALVQIPVGFGMFRLIRGMADLPVPSMETGGALWFNDLTVSDPLFILPIVGAGLMIASMRVCCSHSSGFFLVCFLSDDVELIVVIYLGTTPVHGLLAARNHEDHDHGRSANHPRCEHFLARRSPTLLCDLYFPAVWAAVAHVSELVPQDDRFETSGLWGPP